MCETTRVFFAITIPDRLAARPRVRFLQRALHARASAMPPVDHDHASFPFDWLAFLGDVRNRNLNDLFERVGSTVCSFEPFDLEFAGLGAFPSPVRPRVLWAGLSVPNSELLLDIRKSVVDAASEAGCPCADERFHPHVTLGRFKFARRGPCDLTDLMERYRSWSSGGFTTHEVVGFATRLVGGRPSYEALSQARLEGKKSTAPP